MVYAEYKSLKFPMLDSSYNIIALQQNIEMLLQTCTYAAL